MGGGIGSILYSERREKQPDDTYQDVREYFVYSPAVGHVTATLAEDTSVKSTNLYEAFGNVTSKTGTSDNNRLANTKERDASLGLDNHGFRYYDAEIGRYTTRDPIGYASGTMNVYAYVGNNPIGYVDPLGLGLGNEEVEVPEPPPEEEGWGLTGYSWPSGMTTTPPGRLDVTLTELKEGFNAAGDWVGPNPEGFARRFTDLVTLGLLDRRFTRPRSSLVESQLGDSVVTSDYTIGFVSGVGGVGLSVGGVSRADTPSSHFEVGYAAIAFAPQSDAERGLSAGLGAHVSGYQVLAGEDRGTCFRVGASYEYFSQSMAPLVGNEYVGGYLSVFAEARTPLGGFFKGKAALSAKFETYLVDEQVPGGGRPSMASVGLAANF
jgi:RHS repeat-associated protein